MQKFGEVKFSKDRVKIQIWGKHNCQNPDAKSSVELHPAGPANHLYVAGGMYQIL